jgi:hypothetical protein
LSSVADQTSGIGTYAIVPHADGLPAVLANYDVQATNGTLTIKPAPLAAKADDKTKVFAEPNPTFTGSFLAGKGPQNGDDITLTYSSAAGAGAAPGNYAIVVNVNATDAVLGNYQTPDLTNGTLSITIRPTSTSVSCSPASVVVNQASTCTATVTDTSPSPTTSRPMGLVTFSKAATDVGSFSPSSCTLSASGSISCSVTYTPSAGGSSTITANYGGDVGHDTSSDHTGVTAAKRHTTTSVSCAPIPQQIGKSITCTATVTDIEGAGTKASPAGTVTFAHLAGDNGTFSSGNTCSLVAGAAGISSCQVPYTSSTPTVDSITASYGESAVHLGSDSSTTPVLPVFYDSSGSFVTGGGTITSPTGAYAANPSLTGKANFGFVSKYQKGASVPDGQTEFQFQLANLNFHSEAYQWLVVAGAKAQYKGTGSINGGSGYTFLLTATDGDLNGGGGIDRFRIKIWNTVSGVIVYDNQMGGSDDLTAAPTQAVSGGSIVIHK